MQCPNCGHQLTPFGKFWICEEHGQVETPAITAPTSTYGPVAVPLKIFLSYGHDERAADALIIKADLERRGHQVWFDVERLKPGVDWERYIEEGLKWCEKVLLIMTPHSVRRRDPRDANSRDGFCLNEIAKAIELNKRLIPVMLAWVDDGPPTSICRIQWLDMTDCVPIEAQRARYASRFERLIEAIEHDALDFEGGQARLLRLLRPIDFDAQIAAHVARFTGRRWLLEELDSWLRLRPESRIFWIVGGPGVGKSAIAAHLSHSRGDVIAAHFCVHGNGDKADPRRAVLSLAYQISTHLPEYQRKLAALSLDEEVAKNAGTLFDNLVVGPLSAAGFSPPDGHRLVVIDAIDEATAAGSNEIADLVAQRWSRTPPWLRLVVTSRPEAPVMSRLQHLRPVLLDARGEDNVKDVRGFLAGELHRLGHALEPSVLDAVVGKSEGLFLYVTVILDELRHGQLTLDRLDALPAGMRGYYQQFFQRQFKDASSYESRLLPVLNSLIAQREPLPLALLAPAAELSEFELRKRLHSLGSLFPIRAGAAPGTETITPFHKSIRDWLTDTDESTGLFRAGSYAADLEAGEQALSRACLTEYQRGARGTSLYALRRLPAHLVACRQWDHLANMLCDGEFLEAKVEAGLVFDLAGDFGAAVAGMPSDHPRLRLLRLLEEAIRRDIQFIARHPAMLFQCLWNSCWWYDSADSARHYEPPAGGWRRGDPPWERPGPKLSAWLEGWRQAKETATPGFLWLRSLRPPPTHLGTALRAPLRGHQDAVSSVGCSPDGRHLVSGSDDKTLRIWDAETGETVHSLCGHAERVTSVAYSPDGRRVASGSGDTTVRVWDTETGVELRCLRGHADSVIAVAYSPDGLRLASGSRDTTLRVWDAETAAQLWCLRGHEGVVRSVAYSPDGRRLATGSSDRTVRVWDVQTGEELCCVQGHEGFVWSVTYSPDGRRIASASDDRTLRVWDAETGEELRRMHGHEGFVWSVTYSPDGRRVASGSDDGTLRVWSADTGEELRRLSGHQDCVTSLAYARDGRRIASGSLDQTVRVWDAEQGEEPRRLRGHAAGVTGLAHSPSGRSIASWSDDERALRIWHAETGEELRCLRGHQGSVTAVAYSPDERRIASGSDDETVRVWDAETGEELRCLRGHHAWVASVAYSPDGGRVVSGCGDGTLRVWDADTGEELRSLRGHRAWVRSVAYSRDGRHITSGSVDKMLRVWDAETGECLAEHADSGGTGGTSDPRAPFRARTQPLETIVEEAGSGEPLVWFAESLRSLSTSPDGRAWAGTSGNDVYIVKLEGG